MSDRAPGAMSGNAPGNVPSPHPPLSFRILALVWAFYLACLAIATYPTLLYLRSTLPNLADPIQHLFIMRWVKTCLLAGRSPLHITGIQYPIGAELAYFSPLHLQTALYILFSSFIQNDILIYNIIWILGLSLTGLGTFILAYWALGHLPGAAVAGMLAMLSGPILLHASVHLELIHLGFFPLFLVGWITFVDAPSFKRLAAASLLYVLLAASAAYFAIFAVFPAALYALFATVRARRARTIGWLRQRVAWGTGFVALVGPCLIALFASQLLAAAQGHALMRPKIQFLIYGSPVWSYAVPTKLHLASKLLPYNLYEAMDIEGIQHEASSYLGLVTCALICYAALRRARLRKAGFFWGALGML
jgi:hypothetical protein